MIRNLSKEQEYQKEEDNKNGGEVRCSEVYGWIQKTTKTLFSFLELSMKK